MVRLSKCEICKNPLNSTRNFVPHGIHAIKLHCCGIDYYKCNHLTCSHKQNHKLFYIKIKYLYDHIQKYHLKNLTCPCTFGITNMSTQSKSNNIMPASYEHDSSVGNFFRNNCSPDYTFSPHQQSSAIKNIITMACSKKNGVATLSQTTRQQSYTIFFAIVQIAFLANDMVLRYISIILSILIPLWRSTTNCALEIPTTIDEIKAKITSVNKYSVRSLIPMPTLEEIDNHCYTSIQSLFAYTALTAQTTSAVTKERYISWMKSPTCQSFCNKVEATVTKTTRPTIVVFMTFWSDGFDRTTGMKRNRKSVWIMSVTFFCYDLASGKLYMVETCLLALGPGKSAEDSIEDHSPIFQKLKMDMCLLYNKENGLPNPFTYVSRAHNGILCDFYFCNETFFTDSNHQVNSNIFIMDNPERRSNFGLLAGNSLNHAYFGLSCCFTKLKLPFEACSLCQKAIQAYCTEEGWMEKLPPLPKCNKCHGFSIDHLVKYGTYIEPIFTVPDKIDNKDLPGSHLFEKPGLLNNNLLIDAYITARDLFLSGDMTAKDINLYLTTLCFNSKTINHLTEQCRLYQLKLDIENDSPDITLDDRLEVAEAAHKTTDGTLQKPLPPDMLYICNLDCAIETMMHLSMNASKQCEASCFLWAKNMPKFSCSEMISGVQKYIKSIDNLKLSDFPVMQFKSESMGGYVAENHRAYMQIAPWSYRWIHACSDGRGRNWMENLKISEINNWSKDELVTWLSVRGVSVSRKMTQKELILKAKEGESLKEVHSWRPFSGKDLRQMMLVLNSFQSALFATDMTGKTAVHRLETLARLYLCLTSNLDKYTLQKKPTWLRTFSLLGMLRVSKIFEVAPYPVSFYEGNTTGEGIVKDIRPMLLTGLRKGWTVAGQATYYRMKTLAYMKDFLLTKESNNIINTQARSVRSRIKLYKYVTDIENSLNRGVPFSFAVFTEVLTGERILGVVLSSGKQYYIRVLHVSARETFLDPCGFPYFQASLHPRVEHVVLDPQRLCTVSLTYDSSGLALPSLQGGVFAFILGNGYKKIPGERNTFSPTIANRRYTCSTESSNRSSVLL